MLISCFAEKMIRLSTEQEVVMALWLLLPHRLIDVNAAHNFLGGFKLIPCRSPFSLGGDEVVNYRELEPWQKVQLNERRILFS